MISRLLSQDPAVFHGFGRLDEGGPPVPCWRPHQVHGAEIVRVTDPGAPRIDADGAVSTAPGAGAAVVTADCIPALIATADGRTVAAVHAGWRGLAAGVLEAAIRSLREASPPSGLRVALGPSASGCCYEVGPEVLLALAPAARHVTPTATGHARLDLRGVAADRLVAVGVPAACVERVGPCTICSHDWPSYRREGRGAGRILAFVVPHHES